MKFSPVLALILGAILTAAEAIQLTVIHMSMSLHLGLTMLIAILTTAGVMAVTPTQLAAVVPHQVLVLITAAIGFVEAFQGDFGMSPTAHKILAIVLVGVGSLFTSDGVIATARWFETRSASRSPAA